MCLCVCVCVCVCALSPARKHVCVCVLVGLRCVRVFRAVQTREAQHCLPFPPTHPLAHQGSNSPHKSLPKDCAGAHSGLSSKRRANAETEKSKLEEVAPCHWPKSDGRRRLVSLMLLMQRDAHHCGGQLFALCYLRQEPLGHAGRELRHSEFRH